QTPAAGSRRYLEAPVLLVPMPDPLQVARDDKAARVFGHSQDRLVLRAFGGPGLPRVMEKVSTPCRRRDCPVPMAPHEIDAFAGRRRQDLPALFSVLASDQPTLPRCADHLGRAPSHGADGTGTGELFEGPGAPMKYRGAIRRGLGPR